MADVIAFVSDDDGKAAAVFGPGTLSALRDADGRWVSPSPEGSPAAFFDGWDRLDDATAAALSKAARTELSVSPVRAK